VEEYRIFGWHTNLDDNGSDGFVRAEVGVGAAGVLLGELAHDLHRLVVGGVRSCGLSSDDPSAAGSSCGRRRGRAEGEPPAPYGGGDGGCHRRPVPARRSGGGAGGRGGWAEAYRGEPRSEWPRAEQRDGEQRLVRGLESSVAA